MLFLGLRGSLLSAPAFRYSPETTTSGLPDAQAGLGTTVAVLMGPTSRWGAIALLDASLIGPATSHHNGGVGLAHVHPFHLTDKQGGSDARADIAIAVQERLVHHRHSLHGMQKAAFV